MALVKCRSCGKEVASDAKTCPHCGAPTPGRKSFGIAPLLLIAGAVLVLAVAFEKKPNAPAAQPQPKPYAPTGDRERARFVESLRPLLPNSRIMINDDSGIWVFVSPTAIDAAEQTLCAAINPRYRGVALTFFDYDANKADPNSMKKMEVRQCSK